jgi:hypothetical protein
MGKSKGKGKKPVGSFTTVPATKTNDAVPPARAGSSVVRLLRTPVAVFIEIVGLVAGLLSLADYYFQTTPAIHITGSDASNPFLFPFSIKNESKLFDLHDVKWECKIHTVLDPGNNMDGDHVAGGKTKIIPSNGEPVNSTCGASMVNGMYVTSLKLWVHVDYKLLWMSRSSDAAFTWITGTSSPKWIEGEVTH